ncbi:MAG TPA: ATP-binding protein [Microbacterium sp.]|nr:ATP-binding protein [Microbacterium sp.]
MAITDAQPVVGTRSRAFRGPNERWLAVAGGLVCVGAVALASAGSSGDAAFGRGLLEALIVGVPIAVGLYALRAPVNASFGIALLAIGFAWSLTALTESSLSVPYTIGRLATWLTFPCVVYLLLAFPDGRIDKGLDRGLLVAVVVIMVVLFFGTAPLVQAFPPKTLWGTCTTDCPENAVFVLEAQPGLLTKVIYVREWLVELLWLGLLYSMYRRWRAASPLQQRAMAPAFVAGAVLGVSHYAHITARQFGVEADTVIALSSVWTFCIVTVCLGFLGGLLWRRMLLAQTLARLGSALRASDDRADMRDGLATALRDSTVQLRFRDPGSGAWRDGRGRPVDWPPDPSDDRAITTISVDGTQPDVALVHDVALLDDPELLDAVSGMVLAGSRHERLVADLGRAMSDLEESRRRIAEAADLERARIERNLHDGAQQRLVGLRIRLGLAEEQLKTDPAAGTQLMKELGFEAEAALDELRALARGVYPPALTDRGLPDALRSMAMLAPLPVHLVESGVTRHSIEIESAAYFTCVEATQNALKHAHGATGIWIKLRQVPKWLHFEVRDDGPGFQTDSASGRGLRNMRDRVEAVGGRLSVESEPGAGTRVTGTIPLP